MNTTEKQINELESLILEGIIVQNSLAQAKKNYIDKAQSVLKVFFTKIVRLFQYGLRQ
jgi:hypothetical protein